MNEWYNDKFAEQGWQCPVCKRVYSPTTPMCFYCGNDVPCTVSSVTANGGPIINWLDQGSTRKSEKPKEGR